MTQRLRTEQSGWERFLGGRFGGVVLYFLVLASVFIVLTSVLELTGLRESKGDLLPLWVKLPIVLCTPALVGTYYRNRKRQKAEQRAEAEQLLETQASMAKEGKVDTKQQGGNEQGFLAFVLLREAQWDKEVFIARLEAEWGMSIQDEPDEEGSADNIIFAQYGTGRIVVSLIDAPVPSEEVEHYASGNYLWEEAVHVTKQHRAQLLIAIFDDEVDTLYKGMTLATLVANALTEDNALAVYTDGMVYAPDYYREAVRTAHDTEDIALPVLVWLGLGANAEGQRGFYSYGLKKFGKDEIEIYSDRPLEEVHAMLYNICSYVLNSDVTLQDGETIGLSQEQKLAISRSPGICLEGETIKIAFE